MLQPDEQARRELEWLQRAPDDDEEAGHNEEELHDPAHLRGPLSLKAAAAREAAVANRASSSAAAPPAAARDGVAAPGVVVGRPAAAAEAGGDLEMQPLGSRPAAPQRDTRVLKPLYSVWPTRSRFFCRGAMMTGGETELGITRNCSVPNLCVWMCILAPCSLYFTWVFPHLWSQGCYAMPTATLAVFLMATGFLLATCCSDPGIIPRREVILATNSKSQLEAALGYDPLASGSVPLDGRGGGKNLPVALTSRGYRWCRTCRILRPPRASHCPDCDNCVLRYDHHCPFVNNCVGQRNYHFFFGFVTSVLCLAVMVLPVLFWFLNSDNFEMAVDGLTHVNGSLQHVFYVLIALGSLIGIAVLMSFILWLYHLFLIATKRTTKEFRRNIENVAEEPTLCARRGPRLFDPTALVDPLDLIRKDEALQDSMPTFCFACFDGSD